MACNLRAESQRVDGSSICPRHTLAPVQIESQFTQLPACLPPAHVVSTVRIDMYINKYAVRSGEHITVDLRMRDGVQWTPSRLFAVYILCRYVPCNNTTYILHRGGILCYPPRCTGTHTCTMKRFE